MILRTQAIICATRSYAETGVIVRILSAEHGLIGAYVAGGRGRTIRPILIAGNLVEAELTTRPGNQMLSARLELVQSRGPWLSEPLPAAAIGWVTALAASTLPERQAYPALFTALSALLDAICAAPSARGWLIGLMTYEALLLRELGYGTPVARPESDEWNELLAAFDRLGIALARYLLAERKSTVMAAREQLRDRLAKIQ